MIANRRNFIDDIINTDRKRRRHHVEGQAPSLEVGFVTRTIVPSPHVNLIFHAQLRSRVYNDLVYVGQDRVTLSNIGQDGLPHLVGVTDAFESTIQSAAVLHLRATDDLALETLNMSEDREEILSPQLLVLTFDSGDLHFLTFDNETQGTDRLLYHESVLGMPRLNALERPGAHLAVDPFSRAVAVAARHDAIMLYKIKSKADMEADFDRDPIGWSPVSEDAVLNVNAAIVKVEFLHPGVNDVDQVLLLVVTVDGKSSRMKLSVYEWDHSHHVRTNQAVVKSLQLGPEYHLPQLIIPSSHSPSFVWVSNQDVKVFENILSETPHQSPVNLVPQSMQPLQRSWGRSQGLPVFTQWSKARRDHPQYIENMGEMLYLVREDGVLFLLNTQRRLSHLSRVGELDGHGSTAFACYASRIDHAATDMVISISNNSPSEVLSIDKHRGRQTRRSEMTPDVEDRPLNWAKVLSATVFPTATPAGTIPAEREAIAFTSNDQPFGAISELRRGFTAQTVDQIRLFDSRSAGDRTPTTTAEAEASTDLARLRAANGLFVLDDGDHGDTIVLSMPGETLVFGMTADAIPQMMNYELRPSGFGGPFTEKESVLVARGPMGHVVQVTRDLVKGLGVSKVETRADAETEEERLIGTFQNPFAMRLGIAATVLSAAYHEMQAALITVYQTRGPQYAVHIYPLPRTPVLNQGFGTPIAIPVGTQKLTAYPTCMVAFSAQERSGFAIALQDGSIAVSFILDNCKTTEPTVWKAADIERHKNDRVKKVDSVESMAVISRSTTWNAGPSILLLCGLRDGGMTTYSISYVEGANGITPELRPLSRCTLGSVPVKFARQSTSDGTDQAFAIASCGSDLIRIDINATNNPHVTINSLWLWDPNRQCAGQPTVGAMSLKRMTMPSGRSLYRLHLLSDEILTVADIGDEIRTVPRRIALEKAIHGQQAGEPRIVIYSRKFDTFIAATNTWSHLSQAKPAASSSQSFHGRRCLKAKLCFVPAHGRDEYIDDEDADAVPVLPLYKNEKIMAMKLWSGLKDEFLIIGLAVEKESGLTTGHLMFLRLRADADGNIETKVVKSDWVKSAVRSIAVFADAPSIPPGSEATSKLAIGSGNELSIYGVVVDPDNADNQRITRLCSTTLTSPAVYITCNSPWLHVSTEKDSVQAWQFSVVSGAGFSTYTLIRKCADSRPGRSLCHLIYSLDDLDSRRQPETSQRSSESSAGIGADLDAPLAFTIASNFDGRIVGAGPKARQDFSEPCKVLFEAQLNQPIMSLVRGMFRPPWREIQHHGVLVGNVLGCALDGSFHSMMIVDERSRTLLKFLENLVRWDKKRTRHSRGIFGDRAEQGAITIDPARDIQIPGDDKPRQNWINGDLLARFLSHRGEDELLELMDRGWAEDDNQQRYRGNHKEVRIPRFIEIVDQVCGTSATDLDSAVTACIGWLADVLNPVL